MEIWLTDQILPFCDSSSASGFQGKRCESAKPWCIAGMPSEHMVSSPTIKQNVIFELEIELMCPVRHIIKVNAVFKNKQKKIPYFI